MSVGDITSGARGTGARYNDGKPNLALIPLEYIGLTYADLAVVPDVLVHLGKFQTTRETEELYIAIDLLRDHWKDAARVFMYGAEKYAAWNWAKGMAWSIPLACAARHALAWCEDVAENPVDEESGLPHVGHLLCNLVMLRLYVESYPEGNDLPPAEYFVPRRSPE